MTERPRRGTNLPGKVARIDSGTAHSARVYNYWLDGKDNFPANREAEERVLAVSPGLRLQADGIHAARRKPRGRFGLGSRPTSTTSRAIGLVRA